MIVDQLVCLGRFLPVFATDDTHVFTGEEFNGFIMVQADDLNRIEILRAIREKRFFASQGPWVQVKLEGNKIRVECSPVSNIRVCSNMCGAMATSGDNMTGAEFDLEKPSWMPMDLIYYRAEVTDENGKSAWTHPTRIG